MSQTIVAIQTVSGRRAYTTAKIIFLTNLKKKMLVEILFATDTSSHRLSTTDSTRCWGLTWKIHGDRGAGVPRNSWSRQRIVPTDRWPNETEVYKTGTGGCESDFPDFYWKLVPENRTTPTPRNSARTVRRTFPMVRRDRPRTDRRTASEPPVCERVWRVAGRDGLTERAKRLANERLVYSRCARCAGGRCVTRVNTVVYAARAAAAAAAVAVVAARGFITGAGPRLVRFWRDEWRCPAIVIPEIQWRKPMLKYTTMRLFFFSYQVQQC